MKNIKKQMVEVITDDGRKIKILPLSDRIINEAIRKVFSK